MDPIPLFGPVPGGMEMMIILLVAVLLFGANKLPKLARSTGAAMGEFKKGREQVEREIRETAEVVEYDAGLDGDTGSNRSDGPDRNDRSGGDGGLDGDAEIERETETDR